ncbi:hypothetical protein [Hyalangium rubrum]|uniref:Lipoprotein n=1 Tax=Hyalangium rubrum TaxID=3103134 RepID=A0ABU5HH20_9BACT|nr:hypothetical protein [Hyalangium sp. s54d21]MDY7232763.1 hypothetical protein [Hyalangium sp. s54d21]
MRTRTGHGAGWSLVLVAALLSGCVGGRGIRKLEDIEKQYFEALAKELEASQQPIDGLLADAARVDAQALREIASFESRIANARRIYSLREMLTAPKGDSAEFIQVTRNKVILYHLVEAVDAENERVSAALATADAQRKQLSQLYGEVVSHTRQVVETEKALHQYLNQSPPQQFADSLAEAGRQLVAFNQEVQQTDQQNALMPVLTEVGQQAQKRLDQVDEGLDKFIEFWPRLNSLKEK